jgi:hypothetical protein
MQNTGSEFKEVLRVAVTESDCEGLTEQNQSTAVTLANIKDNIVEALSGVDVCRRPTLHSTSTLITR